MSSVIDVTPFRVQPADAALQQRCQRTRFIAAFASLLQTRVLAPSVAT
jgi:hypothetical protein